MLQCTRYADNADKVDGKHASEFITSESDPQVGSNTTNYIPRWNGSALVTGKIYDPGTGNIGIGTTSPSEKLDVTGNAKVSGKLQVGGTTAANIAIYGYTSSIGAHGSHGYSKYGTGISGHSYSGVGIHGYSESGYIAVFDGFIGKNKGILIHGDIKMRGNLNVQGAKSAVVETASYGKRKLSVIESPGVWFEDFGSAKLINGKAKVRIEPIFLETINLSVAYHVFVTPNGDCNGLYVANKAQDSFEVREVGGGTSNIGFDYRIVAKRKGYEDERLAEVVDVPEPETPELELPEELIGEQS